MRKKRALTLLEMMVVILLITLITGVIGYNMKGSLEKGKVFRSKQAKEQLHSLLLLALEEKGATGQKIEQDPAKWIKDLGLAKEPDKLLTDGWGERFQVKFDTKAKDFIITSPNDDRIK